MLRFIGEGRSSIAVEYPLVTNRIAICSIHNRRGKHNQLILYISRIDVNHHNLHTSFTILHQCSLAALAVSDLGHGTVVGCVDVKTGKRRSIREAK